MALGTLSAPVYTPTSPRVQPWSAGALLSSAAPDGLISSDKTPFAGGLLQGLHEAFVKLHAALQRLDADPFILGVRLGYGPWTNGNGWNTSLRKNSGIAEPGRPHASGPKLLKGSDERVIWVGEQRPGFPNLNLDPRKTLFEPLADPAEVVAGDGAYVEFDLAEIRYDVCFRAAGDRSDVDCRRAKDRVAQLCQLRRYDIAQELHNPSHCVNRVLTQMR